MPLSTKTKGAMKGGWRVCNGQHLTGQKTRESDQTEEMYSLPAHTTCFYDDSLLPALFNVWLVGKANWGSCANVGTKKFKDYHRMDDYLAHKNEDSLASTWYDIA